MGRGELCCPVDILFMEAKHLAVQLPSLTNEMNRASQPILIEYRMVHGLNQVCLQPKISECFLFWIFSVFSYVLE